jgi:hypothetical protein
MDYLRWPPGLLALTLTTFGCGQPKQAAPPQFEDHGGQDIAAEDEKEIVPVAKTPDEMSATEKKAACCKQCAKGMMDDRTGESAEKIPCADFTSTLEDWCLDYFRKTPAMASECAGAAPATEPAGSATPSDTDFLRNAPMGGS